MSCNWNLNTFDPLTESHLPLTSSLPRDFDMICFELALSKKENMEINPQIKGEVVAFDFNGAVDMLQTFLPTRPFFPV